MSESKDYYIPLDEDQKNKIVSYLVSSEVPVYLEIDSKNTVGTTLISPVQGQIHVNCPQELLIGRSEATYFFRKDQDLYFFSGSYLVRSHYIEIKMPLKIFKIQRRENFRVHVPVNVIQKIILKKTPLVKCILKDLSLGGCKLELMTPLENSYQIQEIIDIKLTLFELEEQILSCKIVYKSFKENKLTLGLQFEKIEARLRQSLQFVIFKLDRLTRQME